MKPSLPIFLLALGSLLLTPCPATAAAPLSADLGQGLAYLRIHELPAALPAPAPAALVIDLRFASADTAAGAALAAQLRQRAPKPTFVLVNAASDPRLIAILPKVAGLITLSPPIDGFVTDLAVQTTAEQDRLAYDAVTAGTPLEKLIDDTLPDKPRYDEASLNHDHAKDYDTTDAAPADEPPGGDKVVPPKETPARLLDLVLIRAIETHRALIALHKLPAG
jgi:hypothetical protein